MPAPLRILLSAEEDRTLTELRLAQSLPQRTRDRAHMLRLNAQGWNVPAIAEMFECHPHTVRATLRRWEERGFGGRWEAPGRGAKPKWQASDLEYLSHEIAGQMFDNEYDLAIAVMAGMKARSEVGEDALERFIFNCT